MLWYVDPYSHEHYYERNRKHQMIAAELHPPTKAVNLLCNHHNQVLSSKHQKTSVIEVKQRIMFMLFTTLHELIKVEDIQ